MFLCAKINSKLIKDLNVKSKHFRRKYVRVSYDIGLNKNFLCKVQKAQMYCLTIFKLNCIDNLMY